LRNWQQSLTVNLNKKIDTFLDWITYKGTVSESLNILKMMQESTDKQTKEDIKNYKELNIALSNLLNDNKKDNSKQIKYIGDEISKLEIKLNKSSAKFREFNNLQNISDKNISSILKKDELYIDFAKTDDYYYIFTLDKSNKITFNQISKEETTILEEYIQKFRKNNKNKATKSIKETQKTLHNIYSILAKHIDFKAKNNLIISPDGLLNFLPFEALYDGDKYLIESVNISYIPSGRELVRQARRDTSKSKSNDIVVFGNIDY